MLSNTGFGKNVKIFSVNVTSFVHIDVSKDFSVDNMKNTELFGHVYNISVGYDSVNIDDNLDVHKYLMENTI